MTRRYIINEVFASIQGEGVLAGTPAVFVRFAACNLWNGLDERRIDDAKRTGAKCPLWCDTAFRSSRAITLEGLARKIEAVAHEERMSKIPLLVLTGGEPALQVDDDLVGYLGDWGDWRLAIETNGTLDIPDGIDWVTVSPKVEPRNLVVTEGAELKVVFPAYNPLAYGPSVLRGFENYLVSPQAKGATLDPLTMRMAARFCIENPPWCLSLQTHKVVGLP